MQIVTNIVFVKLQKSVDLKKKVSIKWCFYLQYKRVSITQIFVITVT